MPTSNDPASSSWLIHADPLLNAAMRRREVDALGGVEGLRVRVAGYLSGDGDLQLEPRVRAWRRASRCRTPATAPLALTSPIGYRRAARASPTRGTVKALDRGVGLGPERLHVGSHAELPKAGHIRRVGQLEVRHVMAGVVPAVGGARGFDGVQATAHRPVTERVLVRLEPERIQGHDGLGQHLGVDELDPPVVAPAEVALRRGRAWSRCSSRGTRRASSSPWWRATWPPVARSRCSTNRSTCSMPPWRSHHIAVTTRAVRPPSSSSER